ncbi:MAG: hypothetical protein ACD_75C01880G0001, partial [uncultured bacterium]
MGRTALIDQTRHPELLFFNYLAQQCPFDHLEPTILDHGRGKPFGHDTSHVFRGKR